MSARNPILCLLAGLALAAPVRATNSTIHSTQRWSWSSGASWMNWRVNSSNGVVVGRYFLSGWIYSGTCGWIHVGNGRPSNGMHYANDAPHDYGVNHDGMGNLSGYAWNESSGWINFGWTNAASPLAPRIHLAGGSMGGYAWGGGLGWISLSNLSVHVKTERLDHGPIANNGLPVAWQTLMTGSTNVLTGADEDDDDDGLTNWEEYIAGTHPTNPASRFEIGSMALSDGDTVRLAWTMAGGRVYQVVTNASLTNPDGWAELYSSWILSGTGGWHEAIFDRPLAATSLFYRLKADLPLSPE